MKLKLKGWDVASGRVDKVKLDSPTETCYVHVGDEVYKVSEELARRMRIVPGVRLNFAEGVPFYQGHAEKNGCHLICGKVLDVKEGVTKFGAPWKKVSVCVPQRDSDPELDTIMLFGKNPTTIKVGDYRSFASQKTNETVLRNGKKSLAYIAEEWC